DGTLYWQQPIAGSVVAGVAYEPNVAGHNLIFAGTFSDTVSGVPTNVLYALDAGTGTPVWSFTCGGCPGGLGLVTTTPVVDWSHNIIYFGTKNATSGSGGGIWAVSTLDGSLVWARTDLGGVNNSVPTLSGDGSSLYLATVNPGPVFTLYALNTSGGGVRWSAGAPGEFFGVPWYEAGALYATAGSRIYAFVATTGAPLPGWTAPYNGGPGYAGVPGAASPVVIAAAGNRGLYAGGADGYYYHLNMDDGTLVRRLALSNTALGDATYDVVRDTFYLCFNGALYSIWDNF
ncbi:MAG TPA: PQQ-binding-like beta-propeller repeat protein, partial [Chloroflexia bacterium]|nr:PQQ-binding-like beta-propeller repeat protein [Chloroflexia bacterium]